MRHIRNFSIIAHVDHGKSTLADEFIRLCHGLDEREMVSQVLDSMDIERERGITIKAQTASLLRTGSNGCEYQLNLIDTPGHADFSYEVSRSLAACEGALLVVDAAQGVQAQTVANCRTAVALDLVIVPVLSKMDLPAADPQAATAQIRELVGIPTDSIVACSAKTRQGIGEVLDAVIDRIPHPTGDPRAPLKALVADSWFDAYAGVVVLLRIIDGTLRKGDRIEFMAGGSSRRADQIGRFTPRATAVEVLSAGEVGYLVAGIKDLAAALVGDTVTSQACPASAALPGMQQSKPLLFASFYPVVSDRYQQLREAFDRLKLSDYALRLEPESSPALGQGVRCGFLGMLHMEIVQERLEREHNVQSLITAPSVVHEVVLRDGSVCFVNSPSALPLPERIREIREPVAAVTIIVPSSEIGSTMRLCISRRAVQLGMEQVGDRVVLRWQMPLSELLTGFIGDLKSATHGYASLDYEPTGYYAADIVRVDILVNGEKVEPLALLVPRAAAQKKGRELAVRLSKAIHRQQFDVPVQAAIGGKIIARETVRALRKNVLAKCYGGDVTRKRKLLDRQKRGKKRMRMIGNVEIPQEAFLAVLEGYADG